MKTNRIKFIGLSIVAIVLMSACHQHPKVIVANAEKPGATEVSSGIFDDGNYQPVIPEGSNGTIVEGIHTVTVLESLPTRRYVYLRVREGEDKYWIATGKTDVKIGSQYFFRDGLLKTNFESKEYNRIFDRLYLVSAIVDSDHGSQVAISNSQSIPAEKTKSIRVDGLVTIADLVANRDKYAGKTIRIGGQCVKVNSNIMGRNWVHLKDGSRDDFDLVLTSNASIAVGQSVIMAGVVSINKDFGSGYHYEILLEQGTLEP